MRLTSSAAARQTPPMTVSVARPPTVAKRRPPRAGPAIMVALKVVASRALPRSQSRLGTTNGISERVPTEVDAGGLALRSLVRAWEVRREGARRRCLDGTETPVPPLARDGPGRNPGAPRGAGPGCPPPVAPPVRPA